MTKPTVERDQFQSMSATQRIEAVELAIRSVPIADLVTSHDAMTEVLRSGRKSETPDAPIEVNTREDMPGKYEIADGHHRVAESLRRGASQIMARIDPRQDEEPYEAPFYDFSKRVLGPVT